MKTYNVEETCALLKADRTTILDLVDIGEIPAAKIGRGWVFREEDLDTYLTNKVRLQTAERQARANESAESAESRGRTRNKSEFATSGAKRRKRQYPDLQAVGQGAPT